MNVNKGMRADNSFAAPPDRLQVSLAGAVIHLNYLNAKWSINNCRVMYYSLMCL